MERFVFGCHGIKNGAPEEIRTPDPLLRRQLLYPAELQARGRGSKIRTYDHSLPKRVRYQTALYPETSDLKVLRLNNQSPLHKNLMMGKCFHAIKNFRRKSSCSIS